MLNNIKSKFILKKIFQYIEYRKELIIIKYNKQLSKNLDITIKDYENYILTKFNKKNNANITDINTVEIDLSWKKKGDKGLKDLCKIGFKELKKLNLHYNQIYDISVLAEAKFDKLEELNLGNNNIWNINDLEKMNFKELKKLQLYNNDIENIKVLEKVKFDKLEELNLGFNDIRDINVFNNVNFKELKILYLHGNIISDKKKFPKDKFQKLEILDLR